jgi:hypothetical protein
MKFRSRLIAWIWDGRSRRCATWFPVVVAGLAIAALLSGCAASRREPGTFSRSFDYGRDTFSYSNELFWVYQTNLATGKMVHEWREPRPTYAQHCFAVARSARQFFQHAQFDPGLPRTDEPAYRRLVRQVIAEDPRHELGASNKVVIPGFAGLREFSRAYEELLKAECGGMWRSYFQRGNWRMIFPFSEKNQRRAADQLVASLRRHRPPVVHVAHFPRLQINHALVLYDVRATAEGWEFSVYDPNFTHEPTRLLFRSETGRFHFPQQPYFIGGEVDVYEIYRRWNY